MAGDVEPKALPEEPTLPRHDLPDVPSPEVPGVPEVPDVPPHELNTIGGPARGALEHAGLTTWDAVAATPDRDLLRLHGFGPKALRILREAPPTRASW